MHALRFAAPPVVWGRQMPVSFRRESLVLFLGDIVALVFSLWATLLVRYAEFPSWSIFYAHLVPFLFLFALSAGVFLIAGLYEKHTLFVKSRLPETVFYAQIANVIVGALFFFLVPYFGIQPKTNLFIYLLLSTALVSGWRLYVFPLVSAGSPEPALLVGTGAAYREVLEEINGNTSHAIRFVREIETRDPPGKGAEEAIRAAAVDGLSTIVAPFSLLRESAARGWEELILKGVRFVDLETLYENLFDRAALPLLDDRWFLEERSRTPAAMYDIFKRLTDVFISALALALLSPFLLAIGLVLSMGGSAFIFQTRVGKGGREITIIKFRTMLFDDGEDPEKKARNKITRFGAFLRKTRLDELPQFWNVLRGDLSLIGPRPEIPRFVDAYAKEIPYYRMRHLLTPGISGWAQIKHASPPKFMLDVEATRNKLSYDLYYLKHRSFLLDMQIVLRTLKIFLVWASR